MGGREREAWRHTTLTVRGAELGWGECWVGGEGGGTADQLLLGWAGDVCYVVLAFPAHSTLDTGHTLGCKVSAS